MPEREWLKPEEVRLLTATSWGLDLPHVLTFYDWRTFYYRRIGPPFTAESVAHLQSFIEARSKTPDEHSDDSVMPPGPPARSGMQYVFRDDLRLDQRIARDTYGHINRRNHLLIRGLAALLKANLLASHDAFHVESCISLYVALDASFQLVLARLRRTMRNPTAVDAGAFVEKAFGEPTRGFKYFEDFYSDRLMALHPVSREGVYPDVPVSVSDRYQLHRALIEVYRYLVTGVADTIF